MHHGLGLVRALLLVVAWLITSGGTFSTNFIMDPDDRAEALKAAMALIGPHARAHSVTIDPWRLTIITADRQNPNRLVQWGFAAHRVARAIMVTAPFGPDPATAPGYGANLESTLFDLDAVDFSIADKMIADSIHRSALEQTATVSSMLLRRPYFLATGRVDGEAQWTLQIGSASESTIVIADAKGAVLHIDLTNTHRAQALNIIEKPETIAEAAATFRDRVGSGPVLTSVAIGKQEIRFTTNLREPGPASDIGQSVVQVYIWKLGDFGREYRTTPAGSGMFKPPQAFSINDVDWTVAARLVPAAVKKVGIPGAQVTNIDVHKSDNPPGTVTWSLDTGVDIFSPSTKVVADAKGTILNVVAPFGIPRMPGQ